MIKTIIQIMGKSVELEITEDQARAISEAFTSSAESKLQPHQQYYLKACAITGKIPVPELEGNDLRDLDKVSSDAYDRLVICIRAKNMIGREIWIPIYDGSERHYCPVWTINESGFGFSHTCCDYWGTHTTVGSRLEYRTRELSDEGAVEFLPYYKAYNSPITS